METFYKIAKPDGWDFHTGRTINYRDNIGKIVRRKRRGKVSLCTETAIHASRDPNQCFIGGEIPCSLYLVSGVPYVEDEDKCGFKQLKIIKELQPEKVFKWRYKETCNPVNPFTIKPPRKITKEHIRLLKQWASIRASIRASTWASVRDSIRASTWDSTWGSVWDSIWASVWASVWDSVRDSVWDSVRASVWDSTWDSIWAYSGWIFAPIVKKWKYIKHKPGEYPFQSAIDLWMMGVVPSYDGEKWRLHGGKNADILWEGEL